MLDLDKARRLAKQVIDRDGTDFIYRSDAEGCHYERYGKPSCLVGQILYLDGWTIAELRALDRLSDVDDSYGINAGDLSKRFPEQVDGDAAEWLQFVQLNQDGGVSWGESIENADIETDIYTEIEEEFPHD